MYLPKRLTQVFTVFVFTACAGVQTVQLVDNSAWQFVSSEEDPFSAAHDPDKQCNPLGVLEEAGVIEVQTDVCPYATLWQPALATTHREHILDILTYHSALYSDPPGEGYMAVMVAGEVVWDVSVDIPNEADVYQIELKTYPAIEVGDPIIFHVHNHGSNSWKLAHIRGTRSLD